MHQKSLGDSLASPGVFHSVEAKWAALVAVPRCGLLLPHHPPEVLLGDCQQSFQLAHPVFSDVARLVGGAGALKEPDGLLVVGFGDVEGVLKGCLVLKCRIFVHATSVVPIPG